MSASRLPFFIMVFATVMFTKTYSQNILHNSSANEIVKGASTVHLDEMRHSVKFVVLDSYSNIEESKHFNWLQNSVIKNSSDYELKLYKTERDQFGYTHYRYKEYYKGVQLEHGVYYVHVKNGKVVSANGEYYGKIETTLRSVVPSIQKEIAYSTAKNLFKSPNADDHNSLTNPLTIIYHNNEPHLCYKFEFSSAEPLKHSNIYIDAFTNKLVHEINKIHTADAPASAQTNFHGTKPITTDYTGSTYRLQEAARGLGLYTKNCAYGSNFATASDFTNASTTWTAAQQKDKAVFDLHFGLEKSYDYFFNKFGRNSYDNAGTIIKGMAHYSSNFNNAFWNSTYMVFGDGDGTQYNPFSPTDIVGHEFTHAVTETSAGLIYMNESGGLNESFSDIFGVAIDYYANPATANFLEGELASVSGTPFRNMINPKATLQPNTYQGQYWVPAGGVDNGGVHTNSQVQNHWFYLLCQGGSGTNDNSNSYAVTGIGITDAEKIAFRNLTVYLTPSSTFNDARNYAIQSAIDLFGNCSNQVSQCANAWYAVGVGSLFTNAVVAQFSSNNNYSCIVPATVTFSNQSINASTYTWDFGDGTSSTTSSPVHSYTAAGVYSVKLKSVGTASCNTTDSILKPNYITVTTVGAPVSACSPSQGNISPSYGITQVDLGPLVKNSLNASEGYKDFTCTNQATLTAGNPYLLKVTTQSAAERVTAWIDYNNDGTLNSSNELVMSSTNPTNAMTTHSLVIQTPTSAVLSTPLRLRVFDDVNTINSSCQTHNVGQTEDYTLRFYAATAKPVTNFYASAKNVATGSTVNFYDSTLNAPTSWVWYFPGGSPSTSTLKNPSVIYGASGTYSVKLVTSNGFGSDSTAKIAYIVASSSFNLCSGTNSTSATSGSLYDSGGPSGIYQNGENCSFLINPGCASTIALTFSSFQTESCCDYIRIYNGTNTAAPLLGQYQGVTLPPTLTATAGAMYISWYSDGSITQNGFAATWTATTSGTVAPVANFSMSTTNPPLSANVQFTDQTTNIPFSWLWQFGDGTTSTIQNPVKSYTTTGLKTVTLSATNCSTTSIITKTLMVQAAPNLSVSPGSLSLNANCGDSIAAQLTLSNTGSGALTFSATVTGGNDSVKVLICTYGVDMSGTGEYSKTLSSISSYFTKYKVTQYSGNTSAGLSAAMSGQDVVLFPKQITNTDTHYSTYSSILNTFVTNGGTVIFCGSSTSVGWNRPISAGLFTGSYSGTSSGFSISNVLPNDSLIYGLGFSTFTAPFNTNYMTFSNANKVTVANVSGFDIITYRPIGSGKVIFIGSDYTTIDSKFSYIIARAVRLSKSSLSNTNYVSPSGGSISSSSSQTVNVVIKTTGQPAGVYTASVTITGNNPSPNPYYVPVTYTINGAPSSSVSANCIAFGSIMQFTNKMDSVTLYNNGCATLSVSAMSNTNSVFTFTPSSSYTVAAWSSRKIYVKFSPTTTGSFSDTLTIVNNHVNRKVCLTGSATSAPIINVSPSSLSATLSACNNTQTANVFISNTGGSNLTFTLNTNAASTATNDFLIIDHSKNGKPNFSAHTTSFVTESGFTTLTLNQLKTNKVVYFEPGWTAYSSIQNNMTNLTSYVSQGGIAVINIAGNIGSMNDIAPLGVDYDRTYTHESETFVATNHPYLTGLGYGGFVLNVSNFNSWGSTDHGFLFGLPANATTIISNTDGPAVIQYPVGNGFVILTTLTFGWGNSSSIGNPHKNIIEYAYYLSQSSSSAAWLSTPITTGVVTAGNTNTVTYTFNSGTLPAGTYTSAIVISSNDPTVPSYTVPVTMVVGSNPCAGFNYTNSNNCTGVVTFTNTTVNAASSYSWNFGNSTTSNLTNPTCTYSTPGTYTVSLTACNGTMCSTDTKTLTITGVGGPITTSCQPTGSTNSNYGITNVNFNTINKSSAYSIEGVYIDNSCNYQTTLTMGNTYQLTVSTSQWYNENVSVWIDFDNNGTFTPSEVIMSSINKLMTHTVSFTPPAGVVLNTPLRMRVMDDPYTLTTACQYLYYGQCEDYTVKFQPNNVPPTANFNMAVNSCQGLVNFTDNSTNTPTSWIWNFGDGGAASAQNTSHTYTAAGIYTVTLIASNSFGSGFYTQTVSVNPLTFSIGVNGMMNVGQSLTYTTSLSGGLAYTWDFGDGSLAGSQTTTHSYTAAGTYTVKLTIVSGGCVNTMSTTITIAGPSGLNNLAAQDYQMAVFPNPFSGSTNIKMVLSQPSVIEIKISDAVGREIGTISEQAMLEPGEYNFKTAQLAEGIYFVKVMDNGKVYNYKLISVK